VSSCVSGFVFGPISPILLFFKVNMTMEVYAHVLPDMQQEAAVKLGALLHG
jgi:hypothetical protein